MELASDISMMQPARGIVVEVAWRAGGRRPKLQIIKRAALFAANTEGFTLGTLSLAIVGDAEMTELHQRHLGIPEPTDVLTFDLGSEVRNGQIDGEIVVCRDEAARRVRDFNRRAGTKRELRARSPAQVVKVELALYAVHGVLHLAGYQDERASDARRMHAREDEIMSRLGLGCAFSCPGAVEHH